MILFSAVVKAWVIKYYSYSICIVKRNWLIDTKNVSFFEQLLSRFGIWIWFLESGIWVLYEWNILPGLLQNMAPGLGLLEFR